MLTSGQMRIVAYMTEGSSIICRDCAEKQIEDHLHETGQDFDMMMDEAKAEWETAHGHPPDMWQAGRLYDEVEQERSEKAEEALDLQPLMQYTLDSDEGFAEDGLNCDDCGAELVEPNPVDEDEDEQENDDE